MPVVQHLQPVWLQVHKLGCVGCQLCCGGPGHLGGVRGGAGLQAAGPGPGSGHAPLPEEAGEEEQLGDGTGRAGQPVQAAVLLGVPDLTPARAGPHHRHRRGEEQRGADQQPAVSHSPAPQQRGVAAAARLLQSQYSNLRTPRPAASNCTLLTISFVFGYLPCLTG